MSLIFTNKIGTNKMDTNKTRQVQRAAPQARAAAPQARAAAPMTMIVNRQTTTIQSIINSRIISCGCGH